MQLWAITTNKNESDILEYTIRQLFHEGVDGMICADNLSMDNSRKLLARLSHEFNLHPVIDSEVRFLQSQKTTKLANDAHALGADWIIPFDADELFYSTNRQSIKEQLERAPHNVYSIPMKNYFATKQDDPQEKNPFVRETWRKRELNHLNKMIFRWRPNLVVAPGNHLVSYDGITQYGWETHNIEIGHFQNRSPEHFIRKIRAEAIAYKDAGLPEGVGYWHRFGHLSDDEITAWWYRDYYFTDPLGRGLTKSPAPYLQGMKVMA